MFDGRHALEASSRERSPVVALGRGMPVELAVQAVVVVVGRETGKPIGRGLDRPEDLSVEQLRLEDAPEALDLAVLNRPDFSGDSILRRKMESWQSAAAVPTPPNGGIRRS